MEVLFFKVQLHYKGKTFLYRKCLSGFNLMKDQNIRKEKRDLDKPSNIRSLLNMSHNTDFNLWMQILIQFCCPFIITSHLFLDIISNQHSERNCCNIATVIDDCWGQMPDVRVISTNLFAKALETCIWLTDMDPVRGEIPNSQRAVNMTTK